MTIPSKWQLASRATAFTINLNLFSFLIFIFPDWGALFFYSFFTSKETTKCWSAFEVAFFWKPSSNSQPALVHMDIKLQCPARFLECVSFKMVVLPLLQFFTVFHRIQFHSLWCCGKALKLHSTAHSYKSILWVLCINEGIVLPRNGKWNSVFCFSIVFFFSCVFQAAQSVLQYLLHALFFYILCVFCRLATPDFGAIYKRFYFWHLRVLYIFIRREKKS